MTRIIHLSLVFGLVIQVQGRFIQQNLSADTGHVCLFTHVYNRAVTMLTIESFTSASFSSTHCCTTVDLIFPLRRHLSQTVALRYTNFSYLKMDLKREPLETGLQVPFRACEEMDWGSLSPERARSPAAAGQPGLQAHSIHLCQVFCPVVKMLNLSLIIRETES